jgi:Ca-activated chloride channel family protein
VRPPVNLAVVIDRSGSMAGEKLENAKASARQLVSQLRTDDRFSIVAYGSDVTVLFASALATGANKDAAFAALASMYDDGGTNLSGGLEAGAAQIASYPMADALSRIVLISDGMANEGIILPEQLSALARSTAERGVSITTVGVGLDFDERVMTEIAVSGRGNYYFCEASTALGQMFATELESLGATVATQLRLSLTPADGVEVLDAYGYPLVREGGQTIVNVADLRAGEARKVVLRLRVTANRLGAMKLADVGLRFRAVDGGADGALVAAASANVTEDERRVLDNRDKDTTIAVEGARTAETINQAAAAYERGDVAAAQSMIRAKEAENAAVGADLKDARFDGQLNGYLGKASATFAKPAAPGSAEMKRATKGSRKQAYDMAK